MHSHLITMGLHERKQKLTGTYARFKIVSKSKLVPMDAIVHS